MKNEYTGDDLRDWLEPWIPFDTVSMFKPTLGAVRWFPQEGQKRFYLSLDKSTDYIEGEVIDHTGDYILIKLARGFNPVSSSSGEVLLRKDKIVIVTEEEWND